MKDLGCIGFYDRVAGVDRHHKFTKRILVKSFRDYGSKVRYCIYKCPLCGDVTRLEW